MTSRIFLLIFLTATIIILPSASSIQTKNDSIRVTDSNTLYVDDDGGANFTKIQDAINAASNGDAIYVLNGTYSENIILNKSLTLEGENNENTIILSSDDKVTIHVISDGCLLKNFKIFNDPSNKKKTVFLQCNNSIIENNIIKDGFNGIYLSNSNNTNIKNNYISNNKNAIHLKSSSNNIISNNEVINNNKEGIVIAQGSNNNNVNGNTIISNGEWGIGIIYSSVNNIVKNNVIKQHKWDGIYTCCESNPSYIKNNNIEDNMESGIYLSSSYKTEISGNTIKGNGRWGIVLTSYSNNVEIKNNLIDSNPKCGIMLIRWPYRINIERNIISNNDIGLHLYHANKNTVSRNNFIDNNVSAYFDYDQSNIIYPNRWVRNYWDDKKSFALFKQINGEIHYGRLGNRDFRYDFDWKNFDFFPALMPHRIQINVNTQSDKCLKDYFSDVFYLIKADFLDFEKDIREIREEEIEDLKGE